MILRIGFILIPHSKQRRKDINENQSITVSSNINEYVLNIKTKKVHLSDCRYVDDMNDSNKEVIEGSLQEILDEGFDACKVCNPEGV